MRPGERPGVQPRGAGDLPELLQRDAGDPLEDRPALRRGLPRRHHAGGGGSAGTPDDGAVTEDLAEGDDPRAPQRREGAGEVTAWGCRRLTAAVRCSRE